MNDVEELYKNIGSSNNKSADLGAQYTLDLLNRFQLKNEELLDVFDHR